MLVESGLRVMRKAKQRKPGSRKANVLLVIAVVMALLLLLLRMIRFVVVNGHHRL